MASVCPSTSLKPVNHCLLPSAYATLEINAPLPNSASSPAFFACTMLMDIPCFNITCSFSIAMVWSDFIISPFGAYNVHLASVKFPGVVVSLNCTLYAPACTFNGSTTFTLIGPKPFSYTKKSSKLLATILASVEVVKYNLFPPFPCPSTLVICG